MAQKIWHENVMNSRMINYSFSMLNQTNVLVEHKITTTWVALAQINHNF